MKITWLGHSAFRIEIEDQVLLIDPWLKGNPVFDEANLDAAIAGTTAVLLSHGHFDHASAIVDETAVTIEEPSLSSRAFFVGEDMVTTE